MPLAYAPGVDPRPGRDVGLVVAGAVLWGTGGLTGAALADGGLSTAAVATLRLGVGGGILLVVLAVAGRLRAVPWRGAVGRRVAVTGALAAVYQGAYFAAVAAGSVSVATLVALGGAPVLVAAATAVRTRSRPSPRTVLALALALAGLVLLVGGSGAGDATSAGRPVLGALLALVCAAAFAAMTVVNREPVPGLAPLVLTGASFSLGALLLLPVVLVVGMGPVVSWPGVVWLGVGPTALAYAAYFSGLRSVPGTTASLLALLEPLTAALGAALLRDERLGWAGLAGGVLLLLAIVVLRPVRLTPTMARGLP